LLPHSPPPPPSPLSLHDALPIFARIRVDGAPPRHGACVTVERREERGFVDVRTQPSEAVAHDSGGRAAPVVTIDSLPVRFLGRADRKSTRLNSSHVSISYAVFCL